MAPTAGAPRPIALSPFWIGSAPGSALPLLLPGIADRHVVLLEREDGFYLSPVAGVRPAPRLNGQAVTSPTRMQNGDVLEISPGATYRLETGESLPGVAEKNAGELELLHPRASRRKRGRARKSSRRGRTALVWGAVLAIVALLVIAAVMVYAGAVR